MIVRHNAQGGVAVLDDELKFTLGEGEGADTFRVGFFLAFPACLSIFQLYSSLVEHLLTSSSVLWPLRGDLCSKIEPCYLPSCHLCTACTLE